MLDNEGEEEDRWGKICLILLLAGMGFWWWGFSAIKQAMNIWKFLFVLGGSSMLLSAVLFVWKKHNQKLALLHLGVLQISLSGIFIIPQYRIYGSDTFVSYSIANKIFEQSQNAIGIYGTPLSHIQYIMNSQLLNISLENSVKYTPMVLVAILTSFIYLSCVVIYSQRSAFISTLGIMSIPWYTEFQAWGVKQSLALPLVFLAVFSSIRWAKSRERTLYIIVLTSSFAILFAHHLSTAFYVILLGSFSLPYIFNKAWESNGRLNFRHLTVKFDGLHIQPYTVLVIVAITTFYWLYQYHSAALSLLTLFSGVGDEILPEVYSKGSVYTSELYYRNLQIWFRDHWLNTRWQVGYLLSIFIFSVIVRMRKVSKKLFSRELSAVFSLLVLFSSYILAYTSVVVTKARIITLAWLIAIPLISWSVSLSNNKILKHLLLIFCLLNVAAFPIYALSPDTGPPYAIGEVGYSYEKTDYTSGEWFKEYGEAKISTDEKHRRVWHLYGIEPMGKENSTWIFLNGADSLPNSYLYVAESTRKYLVAGFTSSTNRPPSYSNSPRLNNIYDSGPEIYYPRY